MELNKNKKIGNDKYKKDDIFNSQGNSFRINNKKKMNKDNLNRNEKLEKNEYNLIINESENKNSIKNKKGNLSYIKKANLISKNQKKTNKKVIKDNIKKYFKIKNNNKKLSHKITSICEYLNNMEISEKNSVKKKPKSWSKKKKNKILSSNNAKRRNNINIYNNVDRCRNQNKLFNFQTEIININSSNTNRDINSKKKNELSLMNNSELANPIIKNNKIFSIKIEKPNKNNKKLSQQNTLNKTERNNYINMMNL